MGHRLTKIFTRTGDAGVTGLGDGSRVPKDSARIAAMGDVDELNSTLGLMLTEPLPRDVHDALIAIQHDLFDLGGELCIPGATSLRDEHVTRIERWIEGWNKDLTPLKEFILPGGSRAAALAHVARTICRRAERAVVTLGATEVEANGVSDPARVYLNRLSDLLFVLARVSNRFAGRGDVLWEPGRHQAKPGST
jgi:cob(I)alamin adenosyltransferase